jgi:Holliday junction resolvasome RuvABC ATP-dependent DNA helicase subunit
MKEKLSNETDKDALFLDTTLRPSKWDDYIGQKNIKKNLQILLDTLFHQA